MAIPRDELLAQAAEFWNGRQPLEAGKLIFENLPAKVRPKWAAGILKLVLKKSGVRAPLFDQILQSAELQLLWQEGFERQEGARAAIAKLDVLQRTRGLSDEQRLLRSVLMLAELVAKVTYNETGPPDPFDADSGWWIAASLRGFVDHRWKDEKFAEAAWAALGRGVR